MTHLDTTHSGRKRSSPWRNEPAVADAFWSDHRVYGQAILPATAFIDRVLAAVSDASSAPPTTLPVIENLLIQQACVLSGSVSPAVKVSIKSQPGSQSGDLAGLQHSSFQVLSAETSSTLHASGHLTYTPLSSAKSVDLPHLRSALSERSVNDYYQDCRDREIDYGPNFQVIQQLWQQGNEAIGRVQLSEKLADSLAEYIVHPVLLDSCLQTLWAALPPAEKGKTYLPVGIERIAVHAAPLAQAWSYARLRPDENNHLQGFTADLHLLDKQGNVLVELEGVVVEAVTRQALLHRPERSLTIAATFTAEPIEASLRFWQQQSMLNYRPEFAPFNQVFQTLLNPESRIRQNTDGANVILLRLEDWDEPIEPLPLQVDESEKKRLLTDGSTHQLSHQLPNGLAIAHLNAYETDYLYDEIFVDQVYLKHGVTLKDGDCVIDVGANIGLFTLFVQRWCPNGSIYAFEPAPHAFDRLQRNARLYGTNTRLFNCGLSSSDRIEPFTFYPNSSVFSSFLADADTDENAIRAVIVNMLGRQTGLSSEDVAALTNEFLKGRLAQETYQAQLRSLSSIIEEQNIERIDLLKLDAEKSELSVLQGIKDEHWPRIQQIVIEVHDPVGDAIAEVKRILVERGFDWQIEEEALLKSSGLYNVYAVRSSSEAIASGTIASETIASNTAAKTRLERNIEDFCAALEASAAQTAVPHIVGICPPSPEAIAAPTRLSLYWHLEATLVTRLNRMSGIYAIDPRFLADIYAVAKYDNPRGREFGQVPYNAAFFAALGTALTRTLHAIERAPYKVIVLDCDNTLWQGVCSEVGAAGVEISPPFVALQSFMIRQHVDGMLLCLCSKNSELSVWQVFQQRADMLLDRPAHIAQVRLNWRPKSENIKSIAAELNLGLDSFIFVDDNPVECAEVQANCPEVLTLNLPADVDDIPTFLDHVWAFDQLKTTHADTRRVGFYQQNIQREALRKEALTFSDFLAELNLIVSLAPIEPVDLPRISQLTHRTNQFNATTIRLSEREIQQLCDSGYECWKVDVCDRFGEYGTVGVIIFNTVESAIKVHSFLLSCRTLGRGVEYQMLAKLGDYAQQKDLSAVKIDYRPTEKNQPVLDFLTAVGQDYQQPAQTGLHFSIPAAFAAQLIYAPPTSPATPAADINHQTDSNVAPSRSADMRSLIQIANERLTPADLLGVIAGHQKRDRPQLEKVFVAPSTPVEQEISQIWSDILGLKTVGVHDTFFELGGRSLLLVQVHEQVCDRFDIKLSPVDLFKYPTVHTLAQHIQQMVDSPLNSSPESPESSMAADHSVKHRAERKRQARKDARNKRTQRRGQQ